MIVIISDLHLTDGTSGETIHNGAFGVFRDRLSDLAYDASWRTNGKYEPLNAINIVLLGDVLDIIRSSKWLDDSVRPWSSLSDPAFAPKISQIAKAILDNNKEALNTLRGLNDGAAIIVPNATADGKPDRDPRDCDVHNGIRVPVNLYYVVGNHDWFLHVPGLQFNEIRTAVAAAMGLANPNTPFPHDLSEWDTLQKLFRDHHMWARHGDIFDSFNYEHDRDASSLGDAIVIELLNRFPAEVCKQLGEDLPQVCGLGLREIDNVRPLLMVPVWISGLLQRTCSDVVAKKIKDIWDALADEFLELDFVHKHHSFLHLDDDYSKLEWALKFTRGVSLGNLSEVVDWVQKKLHIGEGGFYGNAIGEQEFKNRNARFIVYGHTHQAEIVPLESVVMPNGTMDQIYLNSGTWRAVHEQTQLHPAEHAFVGYHVMTYLAFFHDNERGGRGFESWSGALTKS